MQPHGYLQSDQICQLSIRRRGGKHLQDRGKVGPQPLCPFVERLASLDDNAPANGMHSSALAQLPTVIYYLLSIINLIFNNNMHNINIERLASLDDNALANGMHSSALAQLPTVIYYLLSIINLIFNNYA